jgi:predicted enzyme related to lactoylglutathione lyase
MGQQREIADYKIEGLTIAINDMPKMLTFYKNVFDIKFIERDEFGSKLYSGKWADMALLFCPAEVAQNRATQNKHQFDIVVSGLDNWIRKCKDNGGVTIGEIENLKEYTSIGIYDPDRNTIVLKEYR